MKINLQKFIAQAGICSRRKAGDLIKGGKIFVNGKKAEAGMRVGDNDKVEMVENRKKIVIGASSKREALVYIKLNKPVGYTCTNKKFKNEKNVFDLLEKPRPSAGLRTPIKGKGIKRLFVAGRLDKNSRGLVLITNDGEWANKITHPKYEHKKKYAVEIKAQVEIKAGEALKIIRRLEKGVDIAYSKPPLIPPCKGGKGDIPPCKGGKQSDKEEIAKSKKARYLGNNKFLITLITGKKRQIREMFKALGYEVSDLLRISIGDLKLGDLREGEFKKIKKLKN